MLISQLPKDIEDLARQRAEEQEVVNPIELLDFFWIGTKEGGHFWMSYYSAKYYGVMATNIRLKKSCSQK